MSEDLLKLFLSEECDEHVQRVLLTAIRAKKGTDGAEDFTFNRFDVRLDFASDHVIIVDDLNPDYGEHRLPLNDFASLVLGVCGTGEAT